MSENIEAEKEDTVNSMDAEDEMEMEIDETVPNTTIIENKSLSDTLSLSLQSSKDESGIIEAENDAEPRISPSTPVEPSVTPASETNANVEIVISDDEDPPLKTPTPPLKTPPTVPVSGLSPRGSTNETNEPNDTELKDCVVIDLVSKKSTSANSKCINYACTSGVDMITAPTFCLTFYRVKNSENKKREICQACLSNAVRHYDELSISLINKELLLNVDIPIRNDLVEIDDSDSEDEEDKEVVDGFGDDIMKFIDENINGILENTMISYDILNQSDISIDYLLKKGNLLSDQYKEVDTLIHDIRKELDLVYDQTYAPFKFRFEPLPPIEIQDINHSYLQGGMQTILSSSDTTDSRNLRKTKPISYVEVDDAGSKPSSPVVVNDNIKEPPQEMIESPPDLPPKGPVEKPPLKIGELYYAVRFLTMGSWIKVQLTNFVKPGQIVNGTATTETMYCVSMENKQQSKYPTSRILSGKEIAYAFPSTVQLEVGTRVIAIFKESSEGDLKKRKDTFYPGVVAEPLLPVNRFRYLIFFDDGYAQYVSYKQVHLIYEASKNVWDDMHIDSRPFIKKYLESYPERPMVMLRKNQKVRTEYNGKWLSTTVLQIDGSLVQMHFDLSNRVEWIYRGSTRLNPMFKEEQATANRLQIRSRGTRKPNESGPYVQYTRNDQDPPEVRSVARKSTSFTSQNNKVSVPFLPASNEKVTAPTPPPPSRVVYFTPKTQMNTKVLYKPHTCSVKCKSFLTYDVKKLKGYNPLSKPLLCGWNRVTYKHRGKREINYKAPCGRFIRTMPELHKYLRLTESEMTVDFFDFDFWVHCLAEFVLERNSTINKDMSDGLENVAIPIVNYVDNDPNPFSCYSIKRVPMEGVHLNLDPEFLCGCDCEDDCVDKEKCQCWQLTLTGLPYLGRNATEFVGYSYRRLPEPVITGIYECNSRCKCASTCLNRVVQNPLQLKLQVFKTSNRGWGIRCLNDIPQGAFICIYAGSMLTEQMANEGGKNYGDEYLAELDYIEVVEKMKEDYEEEAVVSEDDEKASNKSQADSGDEDDDNSQGYRTKKKPLNEEDSDFVPHMFLPKGRENDAYKSRLRKRTVDENDKNGSEKEGKYESEEKKPLIVDEDETVMISDDEDTIHEPSSFNPKSHPNLDESRTSMYKSVRELYGEDECVYVMDAKVSGNIGRFLNHSCSPNVFVQNVFVDTHDLRFPWVAFFALTYIRSGTELTWNYNYDVGSVPGKILYCHCSSADCRGRLL